MGAAFSVTVFSVTAFSVTVLAVGAASASTERDLARAACVIGAGTWNGSASAGGMVVRSMVSTTPFSNLADAKDKQLRRVVRAVVETPDGEQEVRAFGAWCKKHFAKVAVVRKSDFAVSVLDRKSG